MNTDYKKFSKVLLKMKGLQLFFITLLIILFSACKENNVPDEKEDILPSNNIISIYIDKDDIKWFGTDAGLVCFDGNKWTTYKKVDGVAGDNINSLSYQKSQHGSELWVATNSGVSVHSYDVDGISDATTYHKDNSGLLADTGYTVNVDINSSRWFGTSGGLTVFSGQQWSSKTYTEMRHKKIVCSSSTTDGWNYFGTAGSGVARYKFDDVDGITAASLIDTDWSRIPDNNVHSVFVTQNNDQWYGTQNGAAFHEGNETRTGWTVYTTTDGLISNVVLSVFEDSKGVVWFGTPEGLTSKNGNNWQSFTVADGLSGNRINAIAEDKKGDIWLATNNGISTFNGVNWVIFKNKKNEFQQIITINCNALSACRKLHPEF